MKVIEKKTLRQRGRSAYKREATKEAIRDVYANGPQKAVQIIPAKKDLIPEGEKKKLRVCAYCRVSTDEDNQASSYELQVQNYTKMIQENPEWEFAGIFADEGISGTSVLHREQFLAMVEKCKAGEIDLIITKQVSRFARNVLDSLNYIFMLRKLDPPVGVYFEAEKLNTLDKSSDMVITVLSLVAQSESEQKSNSLKWSFKRRRAQGLGIYPNWALLGYALDEEKNWVIVEDEADVVRTIYSLYLEGYSSIQIADLLTKSGIPTVKGKDTWSTGSVLNILRNEKYCGDALCQKEITVDFLTKTRKPNEGEAPQYYVENGHPGIVSKSVWQEVQATWTDASRRNCTFSPIANKIICDDCGGRYGRKTWHSTTYRDAVWECNSKKAGRTKCKCRHIYAEELHTAIRRSMHHLLKTHKNIIPDCADLLSQALGEISSDARSVLNDIAHGELDIQIDGLMIGILIRKMVVTPKQTLVIHFLDGSTYRHRLGATPRGTRLYNTKRDHSQILALYTEGCSAKEISQRLGISVNTVRSIMKRRHS